ncbi:hypothetical protein E4U48_007711 [Claviceps purpurea]|nr:hypothetical protein E4U48_007711 [Claviceps purpurea]
MASAYSAYHGSSNGPQHPVAATATYGASNAPPHTVTTMSRWSLLAKTLPAVHEIKALHVYDFDNTLFKSPLPNPALWSAPTLGLMSSQKAFSNGGWWHDSQILAATGQGLEKEEPRAWEGWWNEKVVELARLSMKQPDALCVMLTGRSEKPFAALIKKMLAAKGLDFDIVGLKPQVTPTNEPLQSTMHFKQLFLTALMETYSQATEIRIYEDRPRHTTAFRKFFAEYNLCQNSAASTRGPLATEVIQVADSSTVLDPVTEVAAIQHMINQHNETVTRQPEAERQKKLHIEKTICYTGYMISTEDSKRLLKLAKIPFGHPHRLKGQANHILICRRPCPASMLEKVGGMGSKMLWQVAAIGNYKGTVWAARVRPVLSTAVYHTDSADPIVVLALKNGARSVDTSLISREAEWHDPPSGQALVFETTVGEKVMLRIEEEGSKESQYDSPAAKKSSKRKHAGEDGRAAKNRQGQHGGRNDIRDNDSGSRAGGGGPRGRGNANRGPRGGNTRGGGRGGAVKGKAPNFPYRSLDDVETRNQHGGHGPQVSYDDAHPPHRQQQQQQQQQQQNRSQDPPTGPKASRARGAAVRARGGSNRGNSRASGGAKGNPPADLQSFY